MNVFSLLRYTSDFDPSNGIDFISVFIHKNSPHTHIIETHMMLSIHHEKSVGNEPL